MLSGIGAEAQSGPGASSLPALLNRDLGHLDGLPLLLVLVARVFPGRIALLSSFGVESAVLLHMVATIDRATPILFLDTGKLFAETHAFRRDLCERLGLTAVRTVAPAPADLAHADPAGDLWRRDPDACCHLRKVAPLQAEVEGLSALITGRKRFHGGDRGALGLFASDGERVSVNPLAHWRPERLHAYMAEHDLPPHPLRALGYLSIGCAPCTAPTGASTHPRAGRWQGHAKTECGIHVAGARAARGSMAGKPGPAR